MGWALWLLERGGPIVLMEREQERPLGIEMLNTQGCSIDEKIWG
jgi:hypothetical protein